MFPTPPIPFTSSFLIPCFSLSVIPTSIVLCSRVLLSQKVPSLPLSVLYPPLRCVVYPFQSPGSVFNAGQTRIHVTARLWDLRLVLCWPSSWLYVENELRLLNWSWFGYGRLSVIQPPSFADAVRRREERSKFIYLFYNQHGHWRFSRMLGAPVELGARANNAIPFWPSLDEREWKRRSRYYTWNIDLYLRYVDAGAEDKAEIVMIKGWDRYKYGIRFRLIY